MSKRILIVEDDHDIRSLLTDILQQEGYEVAGVGHTNSILDEVRKHQSDLVMLDFLLPGVNGGELCHEIKSNNATYGMPVILMSAFPRVLESLGNFGCDDFIAKPFDVQTLIDTVKRCLDHSAELV